MWLMPFWLPFLVVLDCLGLCLYVLSICIFGGPLAIRGVLLCGRWCLRSFYGVYWGKWMPKVLRTGRGLRRKLNLYFSKLCICGQLLMCLLWQLVIVISLFFLLLLARCFILYTFCVLRGALCFYWYCRLLIRKMVQLYKLLKSYNRLVLPLGYTLLS
jgi:hypothetical protein